MLANINLYNLIFIDIETVPQFSAFSGLSPSMKELWTIKHSTLRTENETAEEGYLKRAGIYSEFGKIICISLGFFNHDRDKKLRTFRVKSICGDDEHKLLEEFLAVVAKSFSDTENFNFCGHNIREFDIPFICRRSLINGLNLPPALDIAGKKTWESNSIDTMQLWKFGDNKSFTSLKLLAEVFGIPTPKDDIEGKDVCRVYWQDKGLQRIVDYCQKDVITTARLLLKFKGDKETIIDEQVIIIK